MKTKIEIGTRVNGSCGTGIITKIITKSTGYVEVSYDNGKNKKEMAFNLTNTEGEALKSKPVVNQSEESRNRQHAAFCQRLIEAHDAECGYKTGHSVEYILRSYML